MGLQYLILKGDDFLFLIIEELPVGFPEFGGLELYIVEV